MTEQAIHEALCDLEPEEKMRFALLCKINKTAPQDMERVIANVLTGIEESIKPALKYYEYLTRDEVSK